MATKEVPLRAEIQKPIVENLAELQHFPLDTKEAIVQRHDEPILFKRNLNYDKTIGGFISIKARRDDQLTATIHPTAVVGTATFSGLWTDIGEGSMISDGTSIDSAKIGKNVFVSKYSKVNF